MGDPRLFEAGVEFGGGPRKSREIWRERTIRLHVWTGLLVIGGYSGFTLHNEDIVSMLGITTFQR